MRADRLSPFEAQIGEQTTLVSRFDLAPRPHLAAEIGERLDRAMGTAARQAAHRETLSIWDTDAAEDYHQGHLLAVVAGHGGRWWQLAPIEDRNGAGPADAWLDQTSLHRRLMDPTGFSAVRLPVVETTARVDRWSGEFEGQPVHCELRWPRPQTGPIRALLSGPPGAKAALLELARHLRQATVLHAPSAPVEDLTAEMPAQLADQLSRVDSALPGPHRRWRSAHDLIYLLSRHRAPETATLRRIARRHCGSQLEELLRAGDAASPRVNHPLWTGTLRRAAANGEESIWMPQLLERLAEFRGETGFGSERAAAWARPLRAIVVALELETLRREARRLRPLLRLLLEAANHAGQIRRWLDLDLALQELAASQDLRGSGDCLLWLGGVRHRLRERAHPALGEFEAAHGRIRKRRWRKLSRELEFLAPALAPRPPREVG